MTVRPGHICLATNPSGSSFPEVSALVLVLEVHETLELLGSSGRTREVPLEKGQYYASFCMVHLNGSGESYPFPRFTGAALLNQLTPLGSVSASKLEELRLRAEGDCLVDDLLEDSTDTLTMRWLLKDCFQLYQPLLVAVDEISEGLED